uniref:Uncharacterized protein n=1 Tax=Sphaerodactylus townsendi TaxID=933632 RepID=A0ACB8FYN5_9SAUR
MFFNLWKDLPVPFYFSVYIFEVLNPKEVFDGKKPAVEQRGPYVFREYREKKNITFHENGTVSFREYRRFHFQPERSNGTEEDYVVVPNILVLGAAVMLEDLQSPLQIAVSTAFSLFRQKAFMNRTVGELLWGYDDPLIKFLNTIRPGLMPFGDKFGLLVGMNNTDMGLFTVNTGANDISKVQMVDNWNGLKQVSYWNSKQCNGINGTAGELWPPFMTPSSPLEFYSPDACRSIKLQFRETGEYGGIPTYRYVAPKTLFANGTDYPPNEGFCPCRQSGIQNMSSCRLISFPYIEHSKIDQSLQMTGAPLNVSVRLQLNLFIKRVPRIIQTGKISPVVLPLIWFEESGVLDGKLLNEFYTYLVMVPTVLGYLQYCAIGVGAVLLALMSFLWLRNKYN